MRSGRENGWLEDDGKIIGINLGWDFCAEHEWGIRGLKRTLGMDGAIGEYSKEKPVYTKAHGLPRKMITKHDAVKLYEYGEHVALICEDAWWHRSFAEYVEKHGIAKAFPGGLPLDLRSDGKCLTTAWSNDDFGIYGSGADAIHIKALAAEFEANNIAVWLGGRPIAFGNAGLILGIADRIPAKYADKMRDADRDAEELENASNATGIHKRLEAAGKGYYACSPRWRTTDRKSAHPVIYWLNPLEQYSNNYGWFTVEELDQWIAGRGPVPKAEKIKA